MKHSQFIFYLYDHVEYLEQRCDYATGWSASPFIIKEDISDEKNRFVIFGTGCIDTASQVRKEVQFQDEVMKY